MWKRPFYMIVVLLLIFLPLAALAQGEAETVRLLITEVYYDAPGADETAEWLELANVGTVVVALSDIKIGDSETPGDNEGMLRFPEGAVIEPGQVIVIAQTAVGFRELFDFDPDYEIQDSDERVPTMRYFPLWSDGDLVLANGGDEVLLLDGRNQILDAVNYGDSDSFFSPSVLGVLTGESIERIPADCDTDSAADWEAQRQPTPGELVRDGLCEGVETAVSDSDGIAPIGVIQGAGAKSPFVNEEVTFRGVVTGIFEDRNSKGVIYYTAFVQDVPGAEDGDPATSDGIALFLGRERPSFNIGDQLLVTGQVTEYYGFTELEDDGLTIAVEASDVLLPEPIPIQADDTAALEPLEGMLVTLPETALVAGPTYSGCGFTVLLSANQTGRVYRRQAGDPVDSLMTILNDSDVECADFPNLKVGDSVSGLTGPLTYNFEQFKMVVQAPEKLAVTAVPFPPLPQPPIPADGQFSVATFNVENYFDTVDDTRSSAEPKPSPEELATKQEKLAYALSETLACPTLVGIQEVENKPLLDTLAEIAAEACGFTYTVTHLESVDVRGIDVALLSDPNRVEIGDYQLRQTCAPFETGIFDKSVDCRPGDDPLFSRPPLQVSLMLDGEPYTVFVNHFKSKRGGEAETAPRRRLQAQHINVLVDEVLAGDDQAKIMVMGDFNDYELSPTLLEMTENGRLTNLISQVPDEARYSFVFAGISQLIDGILVSPELVDEAAQVQIMHVNADYPDSLGLDTSPERMPYKATDHDVPIVVFGVKEDVAVTIVPENTAVPSPPQPSPAPAESDSGLLWLVWGVVVLTVIGGGVVWWKRGR